MKLRLTMDVDYQPNDVPVDVLKKMLEQIPCRAAAEGMLTGPTSAMVDEYRYRVFEVKNGGQSNGYSNGQSNGGYKNEKTVEFCGTEKHESANAYLVFDGDQDIWLPKSQVRERSEIGANPDNPDHVDCTYQITEWIAKKKGIV